MNLQISQYITYRLVNPTAGETNVSEISSDSFVFNYPCNESYKCTNYELTFKPGLYRIELYGASGGHYGDHITLHRQQNGQCITIPSSSGIISNVQCSQKTPAAGAGGYTAGTIVLESPVRAFLAIGGQGRYDYKVKNLWKGPDCFLLENMIEGGYNNGGWSANYHASDSNYGCGSGGGSTDLRFEENDVFHRVIVAGAGGGTDDIVGSPDDGSGGSGGDLTAQGFRIGGTEYNTPVANQTYGFSFGSGESAQYLESKHEDGRVSSSDNSERAGAGSGWFGGFSSQNANGGAGGGSSFVLTRNAVVPGINEEIIHHDTFYNVSKIGKYAFAKKNKYLFIQPMMYPGVWDGNGFAVITILNPLSGSAKKCTDQKYPNRKGILYVSVYFPLVYSCFR